MIDGDALIRRQLAAVGPEDVVFDDGRRTRLVPARFVPPLAHPAARLSLAGAWRVARWPFPSDEAALARPDCDDAAWETVEQPGKVFYMDPERHPAAIPNYDRVTLAHIDPEDGAVLRRRVTVPRGWRGRRVYLRLMAVYPACRAYLDGTLLGEHLSGLTPVEWDVTNLVEPGRPAVVALRLLRRHTHVQLDMPRHALGFAGIAQEPFLHATGPCQIADFHLVSSVDDAFRTGTLAGTVCLRNHGRTRRRAVLRASVTDADGRVRAAAVAEVAVPGRGQADVALALAVPQVRLWNDERPDLYGVTLALEAGAGPPQQVAWRTGFRRLDLAGGRPRLNGRPVKFRGVNHLSYHPEHGLWTPEPWLRECLGLMKRANVNAIRTHFLGPPALADLCDELGLYLVQELPIDWGTDYIHDPAWVGPALARIEAGIRRDRHHPSLVVWSVGNENLPKTRAVADDGWNHLHLFDRFAKALDPSRPTMFPPPGPANRIRAIFEVRVGDIADTHYAFELAREMARTGRVANPRSWEADLETTTRTEALARGWTGVWFSSEYGIANLMPDLLAAPYASVIADRMEDPLSGKGTMEVFTDRLREEWGLLRDDPSCLGGAYFPWMCAGTGANPWGWVQWGEDADWGVMTAALLPKPFYWAMRAIFSPVQFPERVAWRRGQTELVLRVRSIYNRFDLADCTLRTMMGGGPPWMGMMREWRDVPARLAPGEEGDVRIPLWNPDTLAALERGSPAVCRCIVIDPSGFRPITADVLIVPEGLADAQAAMPIGPDAVGA